MEAILRRRSASINPVLTEVTFRVRGVVSPLLANLFLHYALDAWLRREMRSVRFCRYADDAVIHCKSEVQARLVLRKLGERLRVCGLELHPEKTRVVSCHDVNRQGTYPTIHFTFLGYTFRPRKAVDKYGRVYVNCSPGVSREALRAMRQTVRGWHPQLMNDKETSRTCLVRSSEAGRTTTVDSTRRR